MLVSLTVTGPARALGSERREKSNHEVVKVTGAICNGVVGARFSDGEFGGGERFVRVGCQYRRERKVLVRETQLGQTLFYRDPGIPSSMRYAVQNA